MHYVIQSCHIKTNKLEKNIWRKWNIHNFENYSIYYYQKLPKFRKNSEQERAKIGSFFGEGSTESTGIQNNSYNNVLP